MGANIRVIPYLVNNDASVSKIHALHSVKMVLILQLPVHRKPDNVELDKCQCKGDFLSCVHASYNTFY